MYKNLATPGFSACVGACFISPAQLPVSHRPLYATACGRAKAAP